MYIYKIQFNDGKKFVVKAENLDKAHVKIVTHMQKENLIYCNIICPNNVLRRVRKTGDWHWNHNGYSFD